MHQAVRQVVLHEAIKRIIVMWQSGEELAASGYTAKQRHHRPGVRSVHHVVLSLFMCRMSLQLATLWFMLLISVKWCAGDILRCTSLKGSNLVWRVDCCWLGKVGG